MQDVPIRKLKESPTNPRGEFNPDELRDLVASVKAHGILQPILVRPNGKGFQVVAGARRYRAAKTAGLKTVPAVVRKLGDREVLEIQVVENLQRSDLHPLEEAEGYRQLRDDHGYTPEQLAEAVGKSKAYIHARLKLLALPAEAKQGFREGKLEASRAVLIARIPTKRAATEAYREIVRNDGWEGPMTVQAAKEYIASEFTRDLRRAPFDQGDAELLPRAGSCRECPMRSGNLPKEERGDGRADVCTEPGCFEEKTEAFWERLKANPELARKAVVGEGPIRVVTKKDATESYSHKFARLDDPVEYGKKLTFRQAIRKAKKPVETIVVRNRDGGLEARVKRSAVKLPGGKPAPSSSKSSDERKREAAHRARKAVVADLLPKIVAFFERKSSADLFVRFLAEEMLRGSYMGREAAWKRRGDLPPFPEKMGNLKKYNEAIEKTLKKLSAAELRGLIVELQVSGDAAGGMWSNFSPHFVRAAKRAKLDLQAAKRKAAAARKKSAKRRPKP